MLHVACPSCGERGAISAEHVGTRIKCRKCGQAFRVAAPAQKAAAGPQAAPSPAPVAVAVHQESPSSATLEGIVVDGLDDAWTAAPVVAAEPLAAARPAVAPSPAAAPRGGPLREYKLLSSRDKIFEGKFDLPRLEEALNHYARQGWAAKSMCLPHVKNFQGTLQEELVVLLER